MSGANDKARFYLEQGVPQLQELEQKKIFTKVSFAISLQFKCQFRLMRPTTNPKNVSRMKSKH